jgi:hypothetical protein
MPLYVVDTVITYKLRYVIEAKELEHAYDEIVMNESSGEFSEFSQTYLGEQIIEGREIKPKEFKQMNLDLENKVNPRESGSPWMGTKMIHKINYEE